MANGPKRGGGDMVLGGRHLLGIFFLLVVALGIAFTLGYMMGRNQYDTQLRAAADEVPEKAPARPLAKSKDVPAGKQEKTQKPAGSADSKAGDTVSPPPDTDWDFYHSAEPAKPPATVSKQAAKQTPALSPSARSTPASPAPPGAKAPRKEAATHATQTSASKTSNIPSIPRGATILQVAALVRQADALALAQALQKKKFPAFVLSPDSDNFYRVQVGPYSDAAAANAARSKLEAQGFKSIIKR